MTPFGSTVAGAKQIQKRMRALRVFEKDIEEHFIASSGPGGQNVNKVATCVVLYHRPSGIKIKSQEGRTQGMNRYHARKRLVEKIERAMLSAERKIKSDKAKKKRQNRKRSKASKEKMLERKKQQSHLKGLRQKIKEY